MMSTANWLTLIAAVVGPAFTWGAMQARLKVAERKVEALERSREKQGERIGDVEERVATLEGATGAHRVRSRTRGGISTDGNEGGS